jgi:ketosteroid isomerase-like protein
VRAGDAERLAAMVTDDVVVVHGDGRCVQGRDELKTDFMKAFESFSIEHNVLSAEVFVRGRWAFEKHVRSTAIVALKRQPDESWKVGRVLGGLG